jgi:myo-inositol 2-dehydrogenase / D-chiro-inositol 1-dehydrogenase
VDKAKIGIIGLGRLGRKHAENIHYQIPNAELTAICSTVQQELDDVGREMEPTYSTTDFNEIITNDDLDGIVIASNSQVHCEMICAAAEAGRKIVYTEKPLGMTIEEIDQIRGAVSANSGMRLQVGYNRRFDKSVQAAKKKLDEGYIGKPIQVRMINRDPAGMEKFILKFSPSSGGLVMDMLTHDYDCARWFVGSEAKTVYGLGDAFVYEGLRELNDIDNCNILVAFENGAFGQFECSRNSTYGYHVETEIFGSEGCIRIGTDPARDRVTFMNVDGISTKGVEWFFEYWEPTFQAEMQDFADCVIEGRDPLVGLEDGYRAVEWACAATTAVRDRTVVEV